MTMRYGCNMDNMEHMHPQSPTRLLPCFNARACSLSVWRLHKNESDVLPNKRSKELPQ